ncbi:MAG: response regulator [Deltaproteobacteria bacterium]|nr:response regulator [Deltaproteobacteria bacterium]
MLQSILGHADLALMKMDKDHLLYADLQEIRNAVNRSTNIIRQLLTFARKQIIEPKVLNLNDQVANTLKMLRRLIGEDMDLIWKPGADVWEVKMDPAQIDQILVNLVVNARDAIVDVGQVVIESENAVLDQAYCATHPGSVPGPYVRLAVSDTGCGMEKATLEDIFDPFFTTKEAGKGTGLGLATVYGIVKQNNGYIDVHSEPGEGTSFDIYLPRHEGDAQEVDAVEAKSTGPVGGMETVLLVEDGLSVLESSRRMLTALGYTVLAADTPEEAIRQAETHSGEIHLLITDVVMPGMNGRDLADRLCQSRPEMKCLYMSGYTADIIARQGVLEKGVQFIQKPFSLDQLARKVREVLGNENGTTDGHRSTRIQKTTERPLNHNGLTA